MTDHPQDQAGSHTRTRFPSTMRPMGRSWELPLIVAVALMGLFTVATVLLAKIMSG